MTTAPDGALVGETSRTPPAAPVPGRAAAVRRIAAGCGWAVAGVVLLALLAVATARIADWDGFRPGAWADAAAPGCYLAAWPIAAVAIWRRRWLWAGAGVAIVVVSWVWGWPELAAAGPGTPAAGSAVVRLFDANIESTNPSMAGFTDEIVRAHPELVVLEEATPAAVASLAAGPALRQLPFRRVFPNAASRGILVASRFPLGPEHTFFVDGFAYLMRTQFELRGTWVPLWVVHTTAPVGPSWNAWNRELDGAAQQLDAAGTGGSLVVGDFNATWGNRGFQRVRDTGLVDAATALGHLFQPTWPQTGTVIPPLLRLDHVMTGRGLVTESLSAENGPGSDHRALIARIAVAPSRQRGAATRVATASPSRAP